MPLALLQLILLHAKAVLRRMVRGMGSVRGVMFLVVGALVFALWIGSTVFGVYFQPRTDPARTREYFPMWLAALCVMNLATTAGERAIAFTPAEADFLFPGPFSRRQLLGYKLIKSAAGALVTATIFSMVFLRYVQSWACGWVGIFLSLLFLQLFSTSVVLIGESIGERAYTRGRKLIVGVVIAIVALSVLPAVRAGDGRSAAEIASEFRTSRTGRLILAPFDVFGQVVTARHLLPDALRPIAVAALILAALLAIMMWLDAQYLESAAVAGQRVYDRIQRMRRGGGAFAPQAQRSGAGGSRLRVPMLPRLAGAGPIAWRQLITAVRQSRAVLLLMLILCGAVAPVVYFSGFGRRGDLASPVIGMVMWMNFMFANALRFDFRGDLDQIDVLKSLPVAAPAVVVAELVAPTLAITLCHLLVFAGAAMFLHTDPRIMAAGAVIALPFNAMTFAIENLVFLVFPVRMTAVSPGDLQGVGRQIVTFFCKLAMLLLTLGIAAATGAVTWYFAGQTLPVFVAVAALTLSAEVAAMVPLLTIAYRRFDPALDTPP